MIKKYLPLVLLNIFLIAEAAASTIELTCKGSSTFKAQDGTVRPLAIQYNLTISGIDFKNVKIMINDKDQNETHEYGTKKVTAFSMNKSEINFTTEYKSPARTLANGLIQSEGTEKRMYALSRTSGELTQTTFSQGGLAKLLNDEGVNVIKLMCEKRVSNKF